MKRVAVLIDNTLQYDRRALQELDTLSNLGIDLTVYCNRLEGRPNVDSLNGIRLKRVFTNDHWQHRTRKLLDDFAEELAKEDYEILHCHDHYMLHIGATVKRLKPATVLIYESRELFYSYPINFFESSFVNAVKSNIVRRMQVRRERRNARTIDYLIGVNDSIAQLLAKHFRLKSKPVVTRNIGPLRIAAPNTLLRDELKIASDKKIIVYIGGNVYPNVLCLEPLIQQIGNRADVAFVIIAANNARRRWFERFVRERGIGNVYFHDMVPVDQVELYLAGCDAGVLAAWNKKNLSYWHALDNKLFSYVMAGIPTLATAQPEYKKIIEQYGVGVCVNPDESNAFVNGLSQLFDRQIELKKNCEAARLVLNWDNEKAALVDLYNALI